MPVGRIDDDEDELVDESLNAGLLAPTPGEEGGSCSRPICFGVLVIGLLAFGVRAASHSGRSGVVRACSVLMVACVAYAGVGGTGHAHLRRRPYRHHRRVQKPDLLARVRRGGLHCVRRHNRWAAVPHHVGQARGI
eukprot:COSAG02_NODE_2794_length_8016_cov_5.159783_6_plen_136_part_00